MPSDIDITNVPPEYLPWYVAHDLNFLPDQKALHEISDQGGDQFMVRLASFNVPSNIIFNLDQS